MDSPYRSWPRQGSARFPFPTLQRNVEMETGVGKGLEGSGGGGGWESREVGKEGKVGWEIIFLFFFCVRGFE